MPWSLPDLGTAEPGALQTTSMWPTARCAGHHLIGRVRHHSYGRLYLYTSFRIQGYRSIQGTGDHMNSAAHDT
jgi:hypothetical protein